MTDKNDSYTLGRSEAESDRLEQQFIFITKVAGGLLYHPALGDLSQSRAILDTGAGTLAWVRAILEGGLEDTHPVRLSEDCVVEACDISDAQFGHKPSECVHEVFVQDVQEPFPPAKIARYDLIDQRLIRQGVAKDKWPDVLKNLSDALCEGGQLNLLENTHQLVTMDGRPLPSSVEEMVAIWDDVEAKLGKHSRILDDLPSLLQEAGFCDIQTYRFLLPRGAAGAEFAGLGEDHRTRSKGRLKASMRALLERFIKEDLVEDGDRALRILEESSAEMDKLPIAVPCAFFLARKPHSVR